MNSQSTSNPNIDIPALGEHPRLKPMDRRYVRQALSMLEQTNPHDMEVAARYLITRIRDYYDVIGYVGPLVTKTNAELGRSLGALIVEPPFKPWRECFITTNKTSWANPGRLFARIRFADFESALRLASWEASQEVLESETILNKSIWAAYQFITSRVTKPWGEIRNRNSAHGMRKELDTVIGRLAEMQVSPAGRLVTIAHPGQAA